MTRVAYLCADPGVPVFGTKGSSVHVQEIVRAWRGTGAAVTVYCTLLGTERPSDLADLDVVEVKPESVPGLRAGTGGPGRRAGPGGRGPAQRLRAVLRALFAVQPGAVRGGPHPGRAVSA